MNTSKITQEILRQFPYSPTNDQKLLIHDLATFITDASPNLLFLLKGYAGTGKTTIVSNLVRILETRYEGAVLLAPTGRAAKVLASYSGRKAYTIHKKIYRLQSNADGSIQVAIQYNKHKNTFFIVDEASMIASGKESESSLFGESNLLDDLVQFVYSGKNCRLILIGDTAQLPPVRQPESLALNSLYIANAYHLNVMSYELKEVVRQASESGVLYHATMIRQLIANNKNVFPKFRQHEFSDFVRLNGEDVADEINNAFNPMNLHDALIICRSNKRANLYNQSIRHRVLYMDDEINSGDLLMVVKNNYYWLPQESEAGFIANGDIVEIKRINRREDLYGFRFADLTIALVDYPDEPDIEIKILLDTLQAEGASLSQNQYKTLFEGVAGEYAHIQNKTTRLSKIRENPYLQALQVKFAYALTCHKSQGGQWKSVFIDMGFIPGNTPDNEYLKWLYTAITRSTDTVYLMNFRDDFFE
jgi:exodeoxyribonuclease V